MICLALISQQKKCEIFFFHGALCHLVIRHRLMDSKSQLLLFLHYNQLIFSLLLFHFLGLLPSV